MRNNAVADALSHWFTHTGAYVLTDGQFGSTGKGVIAAAMAECFADQVDLVVSNAGPNSGHTFYANGERVVLKQLPSFAVAASKIPHYRVMNDFPGKGVDGSIAPPIYLSAGAVIDPEILVRECEEHKYQVSVHPNAAIIYAEDKHHDLQNVQSMASTGQGVGPAIINKLRRVEGGTVDTSEWRLRAPSSVVIERPDHDFFADKMMFFEVSQGFSLGINSGFYPHVTTRECTVAQAISDAGLSPKTFQKSILSVRTFPIRVGSTENSSGPCYPDQMETSWDRIGVPQEYTTVTKRVRRVFTWSDLQFKEAVFANTPEAIFLNFCNYLREDDVEHFVWEHVCRPYLEVMDSLPRTILLGFGPKSEDIKVWKP